MSETDRPVRGILFAHAGVAAALIEAVEQVTGIRDALAPLSNAEGAPHVLGARLTELLGAGPAIVFTDLRSSSCSVLAARVCTGTGSRAVISGVNMAMLMDFVFHRTLSLDELVPRLIANGRASVEVMAMGESEPGDLPR
jgi:mannose/fructose-specific phosphotransferase system component IIA